jgi:hypothetical protein
MCTRAGSRADPIRQPGAVRSRCWSAPKEPPRRVRSASRTNRARSCPHILGYAARGEPLYASFSASLLIAADQPRHVACSNPPARAAPLVLAREITPQEARSADSHRRSSAGGPRSPPRPPTNAVRRRGRPSAREKHPGSRPALPASLRSPAGAVPGTGQPGCRSQSLTRLAPSRCARSGAKTLALARCPCRAARSLYSLAHMCTHCGAHHRSLAVCAQFPP